MGQWTPDESLDLQDCAEIPHELRVIYKFLREATFTKYSHTPNYERFKFLARNLDHFVKLPEKRREQAESVTFSLFYPFYENILRSAL